MIGFILVNCFFTKKKVWIILADYIIESGEDIRNSADISYPTTIMLRLSDVMHIELYYNEENTVL